MRLTCFALLARLAARGRPEPLRPRVPPADVLLAQPLVFLRGAQRVRMRLREPLWRAQTARTLSQPRLSHGSPPTHAHRRAAAPTRWLPSRRRRQHHHQHPPSQPSRPRRRPAPPGRRRPRAPPPADLAAVGAHGALGGVRRPGPMAERGDVGADVRRPRRPHRGGRTVRRHARVAARRQLHAQDGRRVRRRLAGRLLVGASLDWQRELQPGDFPAGVP